ncbi:ankyrin repeat domain-containing protein [Stenotrophomonas sp. S39]|uniref:ankyrin repeat domain-containing protein n=1 Tax=Stenotrophomonas sp. S39 TaxID=2767451 RepID=UPI00190DA669|nr:ankyrin repeat domain-containing protein [Stenotrophomonas sp. S39]MBK0052959.1 ankyrin repeat domain-containing protein [Stenotrophomonas sp. S39]
MGEDNSPDPFGHTPVHIAVIAGDYDELQRLVDAGADINIKNLRGETPLHTILWRTTMLKKSVPELFEAERHAIRTVLSLGADPERRTHYGMDAYDLAAFTARLDLVEYIRVEAQRARISKAIVWSGARGKMRKL